MRIRQLSTLALAAVGEMIAAAVAAAPAPAPANTAAQILFVLRGANFQSIADQQFTKLHTGTRYRITDIFADRVSGAVSVACLGGIYTGANKTGQALVAATQAWLGLAGLLKRVTAILNTPTDTDVQTATPYLSLSTASIGAVTADVFIVGVIAD